MLQELSYEAEYVLLFDETWVCCGLSSLRSIVWHLVFDQNFEFLYQQFEGAVYHQLSSLHLLLVCSAQEHTRQLTSMTNYMVVGVGWALEQTLKSMVNKRLSAAPAQ